MCRPAKGNPHRRQPGWRKHGILQARVIRNPSGIPSWGFPEPQPSPLCGAGKRGNRADSSSTVYPCHSPGSVFCPGSKRLAFSITVCSASHAKPSASSSVLARPERFHRPAECRWRAEKLDSCPGAAMEGVTNQKLQQLSGWGLQPSQPNTASKSAVVRWALSWLRLRLLDVAIKHSASSGSERQKHHASAPGSYSFTKSTSSSWFLSTAMALGHEQGTSCIKIRGCSVRPRENGARNGARGATLAWQGAFQPGSGSREIRYH